MKIKNVLFLAAIVIFIPTVAFAGLFSRAKDSDEIQRDQQKSLLDEATKQVGMPAIKNFRERKLLKDIFELRDQDGLITYTYLWNEFNGKLVFFCNSVGYGIPYSTQFTSPMKLADDYIGRYSEASAIPQADPNGLFSPESASGTWIMCKDPNGDKTRPVFVEPNIVVSPFKLK